MSETFDDELTAPRIPGYSGGNSDSGGGGGSTAGSSAAGSSRDLEEEPDLTPSTPMGGDDNDKEMAETSDIIPRMPKQESEDEEEDAMSDIDVQDVTLQGAETGSLSPKSHDNAGVSTPGPQDARDGFSDDDDELGFSAADINMDDVPSGKREASQQSGSGDESDKNPEHRENEEFGNHSPRLDGLDDDVNPSGSDQEWANDRKRLKKRKNKRQCEEVDEVEPDGDMNEPKPAKLAFSFFVQEHQRSEEFQDVDDSERQQLLQRKWQDLSEEEKQVYQSKENLDKTRYTQEKEEYLKIHPDWKPQKKRLNPQRQRRQQRQVAPQASKKRQRKMKSRKAAENNPLMPENAARLAQEARDKGEVYQEEPQEQSMSYFDEVVENMKKNRRRGQELSADELSDMAKMFLHQMNGAYEDDIELNNKRQPAYNKLQMLPEVVSQVNKLAVRNEMLDKNEANNGGLLARFRDWLKPLPDGSLPSMKVRAEIYRLLDKMDVDTDNLLESEGLGVELINLWKHPKETPENKKALHRLIEKWCRMIFGRETDYKALGQREEERRHEIRARVNTLKRGQRKFDDKKRMRARVPDRAWFDFAVRPRGNMNEGDGTGGMSNKLTRRKRIEKKLIRIEKATGVRRAAKVSVSSYH